jgi:hypothetical protein
VSVGWNEDYAGCFKRILKLREIGGENPALASLKAKDCGICDA